ncbi:MAG: hypothetical protein ABIK62_04455 [candidate division WOR-3 bacterium]
MIGGLRAGRYRVRAFAAGFQLAYYPESVDVFEGRVTSDIDFSLLLPVPVGSAVFGVRSMARSLSGPQAHTNHATSCSQRPAT